METSVSHQQAMSRWGESLSQKNRDKYYKNPKLCKTCGSAIPFEKKFNAHCSMNCLVCGSLTKPGKKYCSQSCSGKSKDIKHFCEFMIVAPGRMIMSPNITFEMDRSSLPVTADASKVPHNALFDARALAGVV